MTEYKLKFKPTGIVYSLPEEEIRRIFKEDHGFNYELVDGDLDLSEGGVTEITTTFEQVVEGDEPRSLHDYTKKELVAFAEENGLDTSGNKPELLERCLEFKCGDTGAPENAPVEEETAEEQNKVIEDEVVKAEEEV